MMRKRNLPTESDNTGRQEVATYFGLDITDVMVESGDELYSIDLGGNTEAKEQFKKIAPYGTGGRPGAYDFTDRIYVIWNGEKIQPA
mgnify:CR=1 FL=1|jgi:hypothetical protein